MVCAFIGLGFYYVSWLFFFGSIQALIHGIGRFIKQRQEQQVMESSKALAIPFNIFMDAKYHWMKVVRDETTFQTLTISLGKSINTIDILSIEEEQKMLA